MLPFPANAISISVAATSSALTAVALPTSTANQVRIANEGPNVVFFAVGASTVSATVPTTGAGVLTCTPVLAGEDAIFTRNPASDLYISTICRAAGTGTLTVSIGDGL